MNLAKRMHRRVGVLILVATCAFGTALSAASDPNDPIVGDWLWFRGHLATFNPDGTATRADHMRGTWEHVASPTVNRHYRVVWERGKFIDIVIFAENEQSAYVHGILGHRYHVRRALPDKPAG